LSLTRSWMAWVHSLAYSAQFAPLYILYRNLDHSLSVTTPWAVGAVLALLVLDGLLILVVLRRWRRVELN